MASTLGRIGIWAMELRFGLSQEAAREAAGADHACLQVIRGDGTPAGAPPVEEWRKLAAALF